MKKNKISYLFLLTFILSLSYSCSVKRYIPENEKLYIGGSIKLSSKKTIKELKEVKEELQTLLSPKPNSKILGMRLGLLGYYKAQRKKPGFVNKYLNKKIGEAPIYISDLDLDRTKELINNRLENRGFFRNKINATIKENKWTAISAYEIEVGEPYSLKTYQLDSDSLPIYTEIKKSFSKTKIVPGNRFDLELFKLERERIDKYLKSKGYYNFNADFLIFEADTNQYKNKGFDLYLRLKKDVPKKSKIPYVLNEINVFPNHAIDDTKVKNDTVTIAGTNFIQKTEFFKPKRLAPYLLLEKGQLYNPSNSRLTSNRLSSIGTYKFINIQYNEVQTDSNIGKLNANIYLSPLNKRALRAELQAITKSNSFSGPALSLTYSNRNLFRSGEILNITGKVGYETQITGKNNAGLSSTQIGLKTDLIFPRLLFPIKIVNQFKYAIPKTKISAGIEYLNRSKLYSLNSFTSSFGYNWNANKYVYHELNPISINYVNLSNTTKEFEDILENNPFLKSSFDQQFIAGLTYTFIYNELSDSNKKHPIFFNANVDIAGNVLNLLSTKTNDTGKKTFLGLEYAQYAKIDIDFRYHYKINNSQTLIARVFGGLGLPYGNSDILPFSKQYFSGGPYSVRAFRIRSLGPGTYHPDTNNTESFFDQSGDIRLEANLEYRFPIYSFLKGALFADAGNVWLTKENESLPGGKFTSDFLEELGMGIGAGLRIDIQNFVIRFDLAAPVRKPFLPKGERFGISKPILNFAIGYPF